MSINTQLQFFLLYENFKKFFIYWLSWVFIAACGLSLVAVHGILTAVASLVTEHRLQSLRASGVVVHGLSCLVAYGYFSDQGSNLCLLHWQVDS